MINKIIGMLTLCFLSHVTYAKSTDVLIYTKTTAPWNVFLLKEIQQTMLNFGSEIKLNKFKYEGSEIVYDNSSLENMLTDRTLEFLGKLEKFIGYKFLEVKPEFSISGLGYELFEIFPDVKVFGAKKGVELKSNIMVNGLDITAESFNINFVLPKTDKREKIDALTVKINKPILSFTEGVTLPFKLDLKLTKMKKGLKVNFTKLDLSELAKTLKNSINSFSFDFSELTISELSLKIGGRTMYIDEEKIRSIIEDHQEELKVMIINQLAGIIEKDGFQTLVKVIDGEVLDTNFWFNTKTEQKYPLVLNIDEVKHINEKVLRMDISGDFCSQRNFKENEKKCINTKKIEKIPNTITEYMDEKSKKQLKNKMSGNTQFIASLNENYLTKLIQGTIENGEWDELLKEFGIALGKKKVFVKMNQAGDTARVYIDTKYKLGSFKRILVGQRTVRFPIVLDVKPRVEYLEVEHQKNEDSLAVNKTLPHVVFKIKDVDLSGETLWYGVKKYGLKSSIQDVTYGLRGIVADKIRDELFDFDKETQKASDSKWIGVDLPPLLFPQLSNMYLEKLHFESDGLGRANFSFEGDDFLLRELD